MSVAGTANDDRALVRRAQANDQQAFSELVQRYQRRVYGVAFGMLRNSDDAMDVTQDAFVRVHRHLGRFKGTSAFYTWLYRITVNLCIDRLRKARKHRWVEYEESRLHQDANEAGLLPSLPDAEPDRALDRKQLRHLVDEALQRLSPNHRAVILMRELEGLTYTEMAKAMGCSKGTIMSRLFHARRRMQGALREVMEQAENARDKSGGTDQG